MKCTYFKPDGKKCDANAMKDDKHCFTHSPDMKNALHEAAVRGGSMPKKNVLDLPSVTIKTVRDVILLLEDTVNRVRSGEMPINTGNCMGYLSGIILKALQASDLEKRLEAVEALMRERKTN